VVDRDHGHPRVSLTDLDLDGRFRERGVDRGVDGDRVVRVGSAAERIIHVNSVSRSYSIMSRGGLNSLARNVDDDAQPPVLSSLGDEIGRQELGDRGGQVDAVDKDVDCPVRQVCISVSNKVADMKGTRGSPSSISGKGPPLAVSAMSHLTMFSLHTHIRYQRRYVNQ
jgi:hypothetical protein